MKEALSIENEASHRPSRAAANPGSLAFDAGDGSLNGRNPAVVREQTDNPVHRNPFAYARRRE